MKSRSMLPFVFFILFHSTLTSQHFEMQDMSGMKWYKGNLHVHAREGESDSSVECIVKWNRDQGYNFLVITDHSTTKRHPNDKSPKYQLEAREGYPVTFTKLQSVRAIQWISRHE